MKMSNEPDDIVISVQPDHEHARREDLTWLATRSSAPDRAPTPAARS
jgi:hypothetical protein